MRHEVFVADTSARRVWALINGLPADSALALSIQEEANKPPTTSDPQAIERFLASGKT